MTVFKWCNHCQKDTHDDAKCWSTRSVKHEPLYLREMPCLNLTPPGHLTKLAAFLASLPKLPPDPEGIDPPCLF